MIRPQKNALEWTVFAAGVALVFSTLAFLAYDAATAGDAPPDLKVELGRPEGPGPPFRIPVTVANLGDRSAEGVQVEVVLEGPGGEREQAGYEVAFVPRGSRRQGRVVFRQDPAAARSIAARVAGYEVP